MRIQYSKHEAKVIQLFSYILQTNPHMDFSFIKVHFNHAVLYLFTFSIQSCAH